MKNTQLPVEDKLSLLRTFHFTTTELSAGLDDPRREQLFGLWANQFPADRRSAESRDRADAGVQPAAGRDRGDPGGDAEGQRETGAAAAVHLRAQNDRPRLDARAENAARGRVRENGVMARWHGPGARPDVGERDAALHAGRTGSGAYQRAPNFELYRPDPAALAAATAANAAPPGGRGGAGGGRGGGPVLQSKEEQFDSLLYRADRRGGDFGGRNAPADPAAGTCRLRAAVRVVPQSGPGRSRVRSRSHRNEARPPGDSRGDLLAVEESRREVPHDDRRNADGKTIRGLLLADTGAVLRLKTADAAPNRGPEGAGQVAAKGSDQIMPSSSTSSSRTSSARSSRSCSRHDKTSGVVLRRRKTTPEVISRYPPAFGSTTHCRLLIVAPR